jgi:hypothetical protein
LVLGRLSVCHHYLEKEDRPMKTMTLACVLALLGVGCSATPPSPDAPGAGDHNVGTATEAVVAAVTTPVNLGPIESVTHAQQRLGASTLLKHGPSQAAFAALKSAFAAKTHGPIRLAVYDVASVADARALASTRASALAIGPAGAVPTVSPTGAMLVSGGGWDLSVDPVSGGELLVDPSRHHKGQETNALSSDDVYVAKAHAYIGSRWAAPAAPYSVYPQGVRHFHNSSVGYAVAGDPTTRGTPQDGIYEIAVVHNTSIDGLPVIGPGGKYRTWMDTTGSVVAHKASIRSVAGRHAVVTGSQLTDPAAAQASLEGQLSARGVHLAQYQLAETQFGYLARDLGAPQRLLAPYYLFVYRSLDGSQKAIVETVPAVSDPAVLADVLADDAAAVAAQPLAVEQGPRAP